MLVGVGVVLSRLSDHSAPQLSLYNLTRPQLNTFTQFLLAAGCSVKKKSPGTGLKKQRAGEKKERLAAALD